MLVIELFLLLAGGALAAFLHYKLRIPLNMPGHHGLEFMAIFMLIRMESGLKYAATIATLGTGIVLLLPGLGAENPMNSIGYILPGIVLDQVYILSRGKIRMLFAAALLGGIAYASIPFSRLIISLATGYQYMAFVKFGTLYTTLSFFFFGIMGGLLGYGLSRIKSTFFK
ncbi:MAG TPA: hypothetical protein VK994_02175 [Bacteroidales bacterium]|nr:hypothetical protein [Bacteroidales bacterium]